MTNLEHFTRARELGADVAEAQHHGDPLPIARTPSGADLWRAIMGDAPRSDYPTNTLPQLRLEFERGLTEWH